MREENQHPPQDRISVRDGVGRPSRPESYHSATSAQKEERILELERQVREFHREKEMRGPPPHVPFAPAAMENPGVQCASGPARAHPYVIPGQAWPGTTSKAPQVQSGRLDGESEAVRTKFHGAIEPPDLYRYQNVRLSPAY